MERKTFIKVGDFKIEKLKTKCSVTNCPECGDRLAEGFCTTCYKAWK